MTDAEVICAWMEEKPSAVPDNAEDMELCGSSLRTPLGFWVCAGGYDVPYSWLPIALTLDRLHLVEERLTDIQWATYQFALAAVIDPKKRILEIHLLAMRPWLWKLFQHATAEQKIKALASVLRRASAQSPAPHEDPREGGKR